MKSRGDKVLVAWKCDDRVLEEVYDYVVVTLPLGVLKQGKVVFDPPLPKPIATSIGRLAVGLLHKTVVLFSQEDWDKVSLPRTRILYPSDHANTFQLYFELGEKPTTARAYGGRRLCVLSWAGDAEKLSDQELSVLFMKELSRA